jgi:hypothetical protein
MTTRRNACPAPVYCASRRIPGFHGFGYDDADVRDPAASVTYTPTAGNTRVLYLYPVPNAGATAAVMNGLGVVVGYAVNQSECAAECPCRQNGTDGMPGTPGAPGTDGTNGLDATVPVATDTVQGKVALAVGANFPQATNDIDAVTPLYLANAIAAIPAVVPVTPVAIDLVFPLAVSSAAIPDPGANLTTFTQVVTNTTPYPVRFSVTAATSLIMSSSTANAGSVIWAMNILRLGTVERVDTRTLPLSGNHRADWVTTVMSVPIPIGGTLTVQSVLYVYNPGNPLAASITGHEGSGTLTIRSVRY